MQQLDLVEAVGVSFATEVVGRLRPRQKELAESSSKSTVQVESSLERRAKEVAGKTLIAAVYSLSRRVRRKATKVVAGLTQVFTRLDRGFIELFCHPSDFHCSILTYELLDG